MVNNSNRINVLCFGIADYLLADTIMLVSLDPDNLTADVISVPRDTFYHTKGRDEPYMKKINAYYYGNNSVERTQNMINTVSALLKLPIHYYVKIEFDGVIAIVDCIGGVTVDIPFDMDYDDPEANLHIHFKEGKNQLLNGQQSLEFLRFRMNNDGTRSDGDIGRIYRQQQFLKTAIKSVGFEPVERCKRGAKLCKNQYETGGDCLDGNKVYEYSHGGCKLPFAARISRPIRRR
jgi:LCP family protein required for cell wall assembly